MVFSKAVIVTKNRSSYTISSELMDGSPYFSLASIIPGLQLAIMSIQELSTVSDAQDCYFGD